jgi:hypothetical protein
LFVVDFEMLVFVLVSVRVRKKKWCEFNWLSINIRYVRVRFKSRAEICFPKRPVAKGIVRFARWGRKVRAR